MAQKQTDAYKSQGQGKTLKIDPDDIHILGLDGPDEGHKLLDPSRVDKPDPGLVESMRRFGFRATEVVAVRLDAGRVICVDGRQRIMAARAVKAEQIAAGSEVTIRVVAVIDSSKNPEVTFVIANEHHRVDSPLVKARKAEHMRTMNYDEKEIGAMFNASRATLGNWKALLNCTPQVLKMLEAGKISYNAAYELGKKSHAEQLDALTEAAANGDGADDEEGEDGEGDGEPTRRQRSKAVKEAARGEKSTKWTASMVRRLAEETAEREGEPYTKGDVNFALVWGLIQVINGEDTTGKALVDYPDVRKLVRRIMRSEGE